MARIAINYRFFYFTFSFLAALIVQISSWAALPNNIYPALPGNLPVETIKTEVGFTPEELVRNVFAGGACDNISQIKGLGNPDGIGYFENGAAAIGLDRGIILSTGPVVYAASSNSAGDRSGDFGDKSVDPDLSKLATTSIRDRVGLEFDFVPLDSFVTFRYVFASEEYCEFVGSKYNDVFGFFVRGPGVEGGFTGNAKNVALIPGSSDFVSINNVNHKKNSQYYLDNTRNHDAERCGFPYTFSEREQYIEYDGFTVTLTAKLKLHPCETYHIRMVVADVADNFYDSAVFLEAGSFDIGGQVAINAVTPNNAAVSEGCNNAFFEFSRNGTSLDFPLNVRFRMKENSTVTKGVDLADLPSSITIPAGERSVLLPLEIYNDDLIEGQERLGIELDIPCACYSDEAAITITDPPDLLVKLEDLAICPEQTEYLIPEVSGGNPDYQYLWSNGSTDERLLIDQILDEPYFLTVTDQCGHSTTASAQVIPTLPPEALIEGAETICRGDTAYLRVSFTGIAPWNFGYTVDGEPMPYREGIKANPYLLPATEAGDYELTQFSDAGCSGLVSGLASVDVFEIPIAVEVVPVSCAGGNDGRIALDLFGDRPPYTVYWDELPDQSGATVADLATGSYTFRIRDGFGCTLSRTVELPEPEPLRFPEMACDAIRDGSWRPLATGGTQPYRYFWEQEELGIGAIMQRMMPGESYGLRIEDSRGCSVFDTILAPYLGGRMVSLPASISILLGSEYQFQPVLHLPNSLLAGIRWLPGGNLSCDDCLDPYLTILEEGIYTVRTIDRFGCTDEASAEVFLNSDYPIFIPNAFSPNGDEQNDRFGIMSHSAVIRKIVRFDIYNRWGSEVFQARNAWPEDLNASWDGTVGGRKLPSGVYIYQAEIELTNGDTKILTGDVLLLR